MNRALILLAAALLSVAPIVACSADYVPALGNEPMAKAAQSRSVLSTEEFGINKVQCISSPAAPAGEVMICEGKAFRLPARAIGRDVLLPKPVRAYVDQRGGETASISLDADEMSTFGPDFVRTLEAALEHLPVCAAASTPELRVWLSESGYVAAARIPVPGYFAPSTSSAAGTTIVTGDGTVEWVTLRPGIAILQFSPPTAGIECDPAVTADKRAEDRKRVEERRSGAVNGL